MAKRIPWGLLQFATLKQVKRLGAEEITFLPLSFWPGAERKRIFTPLSQPGDHLHLKHPTLIRLCDGAGARFLETSEFKTQAPRWENVRDNSATKGGRAGRHRIRVGVPPRWRVNHSLHRSNNHGQPNRLSLHRCCCCGAGISLSIITLEARAGVQRRERAGAPGCTHREQTDNKQRVYINIYARTYEGRV